MLDGYETFTVTVTATPFQVMHRDGSLYVFNNEAANTVYIIASRNALTSDGLPILKQTYYEDKESKGELWLVCAAAQTASCKVRRRYIIEKVSRLPLTSTIQVGAVPPTGGGGGWASGKPVKD